MMMFGRGIDSTAASRQAGAVRQFFNFYQWLTPPTDKPLAPAVALHYNRLILRYLQ